MADSKNKPITNGAHKPVKNLSKLWALITCVKDVGADFDEIQSLSDLIEKNKELRQQLDSQRKKEQQLQDQCKLANQQLDDEKSQSATMRTALVAAFKDELHGYDEKTRDMEACNQELLQLRTQLSQAEEQAAEHLDEILHLDRELSQNKKLKDKYEANSKKLEKDRNLAQAHLNAREAEFASLESKLQHAGAELGYGMLRSLDSPNKEFLTKAILGLAESCQSLVAESFGTNDAAEYNSYATDHLREEFGTLPILGSMSKEAAIMRRAAAESVIAMALKSYILRPFYALNHSQAWSMQAAAEDVFRLFSQDKNRESVYRCQLLKLAENSDGEVVEEVVEAATKYVRTKLGQCVLQSKAEHFNSQLSALFNKAAKLWSTKVQYYQDLILADLPNEDSGQLRSRDEFGTRSEINNPDGAKRAIELVLFPRIYVAPNGPVLNRGIVLWADQPAVLLARAKIEEEHSKVGSPRTGKSGSWSVGSKPSLSTKVRPA